MSFLEVILLKTVKHTGTIGQLVKLRKGYASYLISRDSAIRNTEDNLAEFNKQREMIQKTEAKFLQIASEIKSKIDGVDIVIKKYADENGNLYGSVAGKDIAAECVEKFGVNIDPLLFLNANKIKNLGEYKIIVELHSSVSAEINLSVQNAER